MPWYGRAGVALVSGHSVPRASSFDVSQLGQLHVEDQRLVGRDGARSLVAVCARGRVLAGVGICVMGMACVVLALVAGNVHA